MIQHVWTVLCAQAIVDSTSNNISLLNVVEELKAEPPPDTPEGTVPLLILPLEIVTLWRREHLDRPAKGSARILLHAPQAQPEQLGGVLDLDLTQYRRLRTRLAVNALKLSVSGTYYFIIELMTDGRWLEVTRLPLEVELPGHS